jgi:hypothetical protein
VLCGGGNLAQQGLEAFYGVDEPVLIGLWDGRFGEVSEEDFYVCASHGTRHITTAFSLYFSLEP